MSQADRVMHGKGRPNGVTLDTGKLRRLRRERGWTQEDLASAACVTSRTVAAAEAGQRVALRTIREIASALNVPLAQLCSELTSGSSSAL